MARLDRETWAGSGINNNSGSPSGGGVKYLSKAGRSKVDQDNSARWGTAGRRRPPREPTSRTTTRLINNCNSNSVEAKATPAGIYIYGLQQPKPPCLPRGKKESPRGRSSELIRPTNSRAAAHLQAPDGGGENNPFCGDRGGGGGGGGSGGGIPAALLGSFARDIRPRHAEESDRSVVSSRERAARDLQSFFRRTGKRREYKCRWRLGEPHSREEEDLSLLHRHPMSDEGKGCTRYHDGGRCSDDVAAATASSQGVSHNVISRCSADVIAPSQLPGDTTSLSKLRLCVIAAWMAGVIDAAITRTIAPSDVNPGEKRRAISSPDNVLGNARIVAREFMTNVTEVCLLYAVLARGLRPAMTAAELETTASSSPAVMPSAETNHDCARGSDTGYDSTWRERQHLGEDTPVTNQVSDASADSSPIHGVAHIFFPTPPCSASLAPPDNADRSCTGIPSLLQRNRTCSSVIFSRPDIGDTGGGDDWPTLVTASVLNSANPANATEDGAAADTLKRGVCHDTRGYSRKPDKNGTFPPIDAPIDNRPRVIPKDKPTTADYCGTADQVETRAREDCLREGSPGRAHAALEVGFAGVGTRPADPVPRSSATTGLRLTRKGGGFLFRKRWRSPRIDCTGGGDGGSGGGRGGGVDGGGEESTVSLLSASAIGHGGSGETLSPSSTTGPPRGKSVDTSGVIVGSLDSVEAPIVGRKRVLQVHHRLRRRRGHHVTSDRSLKGAATGDGFDTGTAHTIYGVATGRSSGEANGGAVRPSHKSVEEPPVDCRYHVPTSDQHVPTSGPGRGRVFSVADQGAGAGAGTCHGTGGDESAATEGSSRGEKGSVIVRTAVDADGVREKLPRRVQPKPPQRAKTRSLTTSPREILYRGVAVSQPRYGGSQAPDSSRKLHISTTCGR